MSLNERLFALGLLEDFDHAVNEQDEALMRTILADAAVRQPDAIIQSILGDTDNSGPVSQ